MDDLKFLLIEDILEDAELIQKQLKKEFTCTIHIVSTLEEFTDALNHFRPDVILSSFYGKQAADNWGLELRNRRVPETPFFVISPLFQDEIALDCMKHGATDYISKEHLVRLNFAVKMALNQSRLSHQKKSTEEELAKSLEHFKRFVDHDISGDYLENETEVLYCNKKVLEMFEFGSLEELNTHGTSGLYENPNDRLNLIRELRNGKPVENPEFKMRTR